MSELSPGHTGNKCPLPLLLKSWCCYSEPIRDTVLLCWRRFLCENLPVPGVQKRLRRFQMKQGLWAFIPFTLACSRSDMWTLIKILLCCQSWFKVLFKLLGLVQSPVSISRITDTFCMHSSWLPVPFPDSSLTCTFSLLFHYSSAVVPRKSC